MKKTGEKKSQDIIHEFCNILSPTKEQIDEYLSAIKFLADKKNLYAMREYGNAMTYYGLYEVSKKYYNMVIELCRDANNPLSESSFAHIGLGNLYKNNCIGNCSYELAYRHYLTASSYGNDLAKERIAEMYRDGLYVKKNFNLYVKIITELYNKNLTNDNFDLSLCYKMAEIKYDQKKYEECKKIVRKFELGSGFSSINYFFISTDVNSIIGIHEIKYKLGLVNEKEFDIFSIAALSKKHNQFSFRCHNKKHILKFDKFDNLSTYEFMGIKYKTLTEFVLKAKIQGKTILEAMESFTNYKVCA